MHVVKIANMLRIRQFLFFIIIHIVYRKVPFKKILNFSKIIPKFEIISS